MTKFDSRNTQHDGKSSFGGSVSSARVHQRSSGFLNTLESGFRDPDEQDGLNGLMLAGGIAMLVGGIMTGNFLIGAMGGMMIVQSGVGEYAHMKEKEAVRAASNVFGPKREQRGPQGQGRQSASIMRNRRRRHGTTTHRSGLHHRLNRRKYY